jgi:hypothetical protein
MYMHLNAVPGMLTYTGRILESEPCGSKEAKSNAADTC